ncbi:MAG: UDP-N-acetylglucosamine 1-carboxyvinyltransferase [Burkholderiaceae bacterium]
MDKLLITGGNKLKGEIPIAGAKNAALPIMAAGLLTAEPVVLNNVPKLADIRTMSKIIAGMGATVTPNEAGQVTINAAHVGKPEAPYELVKTMRASVLVLGPLVARFGQAKVSLPGGCAIGQRPVDQHIKALQALGAEINVEGGYIYAKAKRLKGARVRTDMITVTGTENILMAAALAEGETIIENAAREPEVVDLANLLLAMGARISGAGTDRIVVQGVEKLHGATYSVMPDRIEAGTFLCAVAAAGGDVTLTHCAPDTMGATLGKLGEAGLQMDLGQNTIRAVMNGRARAVSVRTVEYPGYATDMQAQLMTVDCIAEGTATISEHIFENRFMHVQELVRLGADISIDGKTAVVKGVQKLTGAPVMATDLRASACLVIAGLVAQGQTLVDRIYHLDRGYDRMEQKLAAVGATIQRIS